MSNSIEPVYPQLFPAIYSDGLGTEETVIRCEAPAAPWWPALTMMLRGVEFRTKSPTVWSMAQEDRTSEERNRFTFENSYLSNYRLTVLIPLELETAEGPDQSAVLFLELDRQVETGRTFSSQLSGIGLHSHEHQVILKPDDPVKGWPPPALLQSQLPVGCKLKQCWNCRWGESIWVEGAPFSRYDELCFRSFKTIIAALPLQTEGYFSPLARLFWRMPEGVRKQLIPVHWFHFCDEFEARLPSSDCRN